MNLLQRFDPLTEKLHPQSLHKLEVLKVCLPEKTNAPIALHYLFRLSKKKQQPMTLLICILPYLNIQQNELKLPNLCVTRLPTIPCKFQVYHHHKQVLAEIEAQHKKQILDARISNENAHTKEKYNMLILLVLVDLGPFSSFILLTACAS